MLLSVQGLRRRKLLFDESLRAGSIDLTDTPFELAPEELGDHFLYAGLKVTLPAGTRLLWPALPHNPYKRDGSAELPSAKLVLAMPFDEVDTYTIVLSHQPG